MVLNKEKDATAPASNCKGSDLSFTDQDVAAATALLDKLIKRSLQDAVTDILQPAIRRALIQNLCHLTNPSARPGGGQDGPGASDDPKG